MATVKVDRNNFKSDVLDAAQPVVVDFWAEWCMPCRNLAPVIDAVAEELVGKARVGKVDTDNNRGISVKYGITAIPTVIIFKKGQVVKKFVGFKKKDELVAALTEAGATA